MSSFFNNVAKMACLVKITDHVQQLTSPIIALPCCSIKYYLFLLWPGQVELPPADLGPTASLTQTLSLLREVLASHDSSVVPLDARQADFAQVNSLFIIVVVTCVVWLAVCPLTLSGPYLSYHERWSTKLYLQMCHAWDTILPLWPLTLNCWPLTWIFCPGQYLASVMAALLLSHKRSHEYKYHCLTPLFWPIELEAVTLNLKILSGPIFGYNSCLLLDLCIPMHKSLCLVPLL